VLFMVLPLVPQPLSVTEGAGSFPLRADLRAHAGPGAEGALTTLLAAVARRTGAPFAVVRDEEPAEIVLTRTADDGEAYRLSVGERIELSGSGTGLLHGIRTLVQLLREDGDG